ncbi:MAG: phosphotransferase [Anaerolineae bacterium]|nr:phosphotransferase [Anaerolineae bacterium]
MEKHPFFNLMIYTKTELEQIIQQPINQVQTLREWPLSSVVEASGENEEKWIVKYMLEPLNIEGVWYQTPHRDFLPQCDHIIDLTPHQQILIYRKIAGIHPSQANLNEKQSLDLLGSLQEAIQSIHEPNLPTRIQIGTPHDFNHCFQRMIDDMRKLVVDRHFIITQMETVNFLQKLVKDEGVIDTLTYNTGYAHGDLGQDNVLLQPDGSITILDWQRPVRSSPLIDAFIFLDSMGIPPLRYLPPESLYLAHLERIEWYVANAVRWNPVIIDRIDQYIDHFVRELEWVYPANTKNFKM